MSRTKKKPAPPPDRDYSRRVDWECVLTAPVLRELRVSTLVGAPVDPDKFILVVETLEEILEVASKKQVKPVLGPKEPNLAAEQVAGVIAKLAESLDEAGKDAEREEKLFETKYDDAVREAGKAADEHLKETAEHCKIIDELRKRAEVAEHNISETVRNGHTLDTEARARLDAAEERAADWFAKLTAQDAEIAELKRAVEVLRAAKPVRRTRKATP